MKSNAAQAAAEPSRGEDFRNCWEKHPLFLMEGALSERLKHEFHLRT